MVYIVFRPYQLHYRQSAICSGVVRTYPLPHGITLSFHPVARFSPKRLSFQVRSGSEPDCSLFKLIPVFSPNFLEDEYAAILSMPRAIPIL